ncbi:MAG: pre-mRNA-splicing factor syf2 [Sclerophora amabilis]|nr:MAG: pre-mRNA-splicing factor syf2 [Sclerophora amabilis]
MANPVESQTTDQNVPDTVDNSNEVDDAAKARQRRNEHFKALQARSRESVKNNRKDTAAESQRLAVDPNLLPTLARKRDNAAEKLIKAETAANGEDFERKRAWMYTVEESEKWDRRVEKRQRHKEDVAFQDYTQDAQKVYKRQMRNFNPDLDEYEKKKMDEVRRAAMSGSLEILETDDGELVAVDKDGTFYSTADSTNFVENKPGRAAVDRLVTDIRKAEETRLRKRRDRGKGEDDPDVTYINDKNKAFNQRLARSYDKYTTEIRDNFERGTNI